MQLTDEQRAILDGDRGEVLARYMRWLVEWGAVMGARYRGGGSLGRANERRPRTRELVSCFRSSSALDACLSRPGKAR